jgi:hypothetical protein
LLSLVVENLLYKIIKSDGQILLLYIMTEFTIEWSTEGLNKLTINDLRSLNITMRLKGYTGKNKQQLIDALLTLPPLKIGMTKTGAGWKKREGVYKFVPATGSLFVPPTTGSQKEIEEQVLVIILHQGQVITYLVPYHNETLQLINELILHNPTLPLSLDLAGSLFQFHVPQRTFAGVSVNTVLNFIL